MVKIAILASGNGSNFQRLVEYKEENQVNYHVECLICDKENAYVLERGRSLNIESKVIPGKDRDALLNYLKEKNIELVVLAGYMRILKGEILEVYKDRIINIHPSLLPLYPGIDGIGDAYRDSSKYSGITIHLVDKDVDSGKIIYQESLEIDYKESLETLTEKIHKLEHKNYPRVVMEYINEIGGKSEASTNKRI